MIAVDLLVRPDGAACLALARAEEDVAEIRFDPATGQLLLVLGDGARLMLERVVDRRLRAGLAAQGHMLVAHLDDENRLIREYEVALLPGIG